MPKTASYQCRRFYIFPNQLGFRWGKTIGSFQVLGVPIPSTILRNRLDPNPGIPRKLDLHYIQSSYEILTFDQKFIDFYHLFFNFDLNFYFWQTFWFLGKIFIFDQNWLLTVFLTWHKFLIIGLNFDLSLNFWLVKILIFWQKILIIDKNVDFWQKFWFLTKIFIIDKNFDFWQQFWFLTTILIFDKKKFDFWQKFRFLTIILIFADF